LFDADRVGSGFWRMECERRAQETPAVVVESEAEGLGEPAGPSRDQFTVRIGRQFSEYPHVSQPFERLGGSKQDGRSLSGNAAHDVDAGVNSVAAISVESPGRTEHGSIASRRTRVGVGRGVAAIAEIGFDFDQSNHQALSGFQSPNKSAADEIGGDDAAVSRVEGLAKRIGEDHARSIGQSQDPASSKPLARSLERGLRLECGAGIADDLYAPPFARRGPERPVRCGTEQI